MNYAPKGNRRDKRTRGPHNMRGRQDDVVIIVVVVRPLPTSSVGSAYTSRHPVDSSSPALPRLAEANYRMACCTTTEKRPLSLFLAMFPPSPSPSSMPTTLVTIALADLALFFTIVLLGEQFLDILEVHQNGPRRFGN